MEKEMNPHAKYAKGKKPSMKRRNARHDYSGKGIYQITIETKGRCKVLGKLQPPTANGSPCIQLSTIGNQVVSSWQAISRWRPEIQSLWLTVMPDHIHGVLNVRERLPEKLGTVIASFKRECCREARRALAEAGKLETAAQYVAISDLRVDLWEPGFNDVIITSQEQLDSSIAYLKDNPRRLWGKRQHPEYFAQLEIEAGGHCFNSVGNALLLNAERLIPVHVSSRQTEEERQKQIRGLIEAAKEGAVLVSPFISKGEKEVEHALEELKLPVVKLLENGFGELYKPAGKAFDACAEGRLLFLAPWEHHNERLRISREQCLALNQMSADICERRSC